MTGVVKTRTGKVIPFAHVKVDDRDGTVRTAVANANGAYSISNVPFGSYQIAANGVCRTGGITTIEVDGAEIENFGFLEDALRFDRADHVCRAGASFALIDDQNVLPLTGDDQATTLNLPFAFPFYGKAKTSMQVSTNGYLTFGTQGRNNVNSQLLNSATPLDSIFVFWDDLVVDANASISTTSLGTAPNRVLMVEWRNVKFFGDGAGHRLTFQVQLFENGRINMAYRDMDGSALEQGSSATIGIRNDDASFGNDALQQSFNEASLVNDTKVEYVTNHAPAVNAGTDIKIASGAPIPLNGTASDAGPIKLRWRKLEGPATTIADNSKAKTTATGVKGPATVKFLLTATDEFGRQTNDQVTVTVTAPK